LLRAGRGGLGHSQRGGRGGLVARGGAQPYSAAKLARKAANRAALCAEFGLEVPGPLAILVSRLTDQKGIDLLPGAMPAFVAAGGGLVVLGSGEPGLEAAMRGLAAPIRAGWRCASAMMRALSQRMFAGGDAVLVPSRFEPCGLTQMYGLRFGAVPVVSAVGGLADTVINASPAALAVGAATGVVFHPVDGLALGQALARLVTLYREPKVWTAVQKAAMRQPVGWQGSAAAYARLYAGLAGAGQ
jgi:starch synthase